MYTYFFTFTWIWDGFAYQLSEQTLKWRDLGILKTSKNSLIQMASDTRDPPACVMGQGPRMCRQPGVAKNHVLRYKDLCSTLRQDKKKYDKYDLSKIDNSGAEASEVSVKPLHVMVILFLTFSKN